MSATLLELDAARIDKQGRCVLEGVTLRADGDRVGLSGDGTYLLDVLSGAAELASGAMRVGGMPWEEAREAGVFGVARPWAERADVTLRDGLILSALLTGCTQRQAKQRAEDALNALGLSALAGQKWAKRPRVEHYLAGLVEAALVEPAIVVAELPIGLLEPDAWARYGSALSRLVQERRWLVCLPGPARLPVEQSWVSALDQLLWIENGIGVAVEPSATERVRTLVVVGGTLDVLPEGFDAPSLRLERVGLAARPGEPRTALIADLARDASGRACTEPVLEWCQRHALPIIRLEPLDRGY
jgi:predicted ABC-type transport system involved in lysophospholipase L1 biosynthesis ATPase subunit